MGTRVANYSVCEQRVDQLVCSRKVSALAVVSTGTPCKPWGHIVAMVDIITSLIKLLWSLAHFSN